jgi:hypothetical protein
MRCLRPQVLVERLADVTRRAGHCVTCAY